MSVKLRKAISSGNFRGNSAVWWVEGTRFSIVDRYVFWEDEGHPKPKTVTGCGMMSIDAHENDLLLKHGVHGVHGFQTTFKTRRAAVEALEAIGLIPQGGPA